MKNKIKLIFESEPARSPKTLIKSEPEPVRARARAGPVSSLAYMQLPPRHIVFKHTAPNSLLDYLLSEVTQDLINAIKQQQQQQKMKTKICKNHQ